MKVLALAADNGGCGFYRVRAPAEEVKKLGVDVTVDSGFDVNATQYPDGRVEVQEIHTDADLIIFQRPLDNAMSSAIIQAHRQGIATIVEIDDDLSTVHEKNVAHGAMLGQSSGYKWAEKAASLADHVTVSTTQLGKFARHGRYSVLRNCVPDSIFQIIRPEGEAKWPRVGWTGTVQTHPNDLQVTKGRLSRVMKDHNLTFSVVGDGESVARNLMLDPSIPLLATGWVPLDEFYSTAASAIDIGIVPLELSNFNQAKSYLKGLEYAALGIPFIASPTREYELLAVSGVGKIARSPGDWAKHLQRMIDRPAETERIAKESRDRIKSEFTYSVNAPKWIEAWEKAIAYRKTRRE